MKFPRVSLVAAMGFAVFLVPLALALAQTSQGISPSGGLVPCGASSDWLRATACGFCDLGRLIQNVINFIIGIAIPIAALLFAWAGVLYFTAGGDTGKYSRALSIFKHAFLGFVLTLTAWLIVQTILFAVFKDTYYSGWNNIQCTEDKLRIRDARVDDLLRPLSPVTVVPTPFLPSYPSGFVADSEGNIIPVGDDYGQTSSGFALDSEGNIVPTNGNIASAAESYLGTDTSAGPDGGNKACAWAVNNVLQSAGYDPIDGDSVYSMEQELIKGRGTQLGQSNAQPGDIVIFGGMSHVGICQDAGCSQVVSNSSSNASFSSVYPPTSNSRFYRVNK